MHFFAVGSLGSFVRWLVIAALLGGGVVFLALHGNPGFAFWQGWANIELLLGMVAVLMMIIGFILGRTRSRLFWWGLGLFLFVAVFMDAILYFNVRDYL